MYSTLPYKTKQFFFVLIKLSIVFGAAYFIYGKLTNTTELNFVDFTKFTSKNGIFSSKNILFLLFLSFFNWFLEILKWKNLVHPIKKISFKNAMAQSLGSLTASLFTPNRIGEYGAKVMYYAPIFRKKIALINLLSNMLQMSATVVLGIIGFSIFTHNYNVPLDYYRIARILTVVIIVVFIVAFAIKQNRFKIKNFSLLSIKTFLINFSKNRLILGFVLSFFRYLVFSFQFFVLLSLFKVELTYLEAMTIITSMYLIASVIPSIFIFDVVIKGSVAVYLFSIVGINTVIVLSIITLMWLLNSALPSCFGIFYVLNFKLPKSD